MKTALVTGASRGIGAACARELARAGWAVAVNYRTSQEKAEDVAAQIRQDGGVALAIPGDIGDPEQVEALFRTAETELGSVEVLVNNAGIAQQKLFTDVTEEDWDELFRVDVKGVFLCCRRALPGMLRRHGGSIVNISSMWGQVGASCEVAYSAAKAAVIGLTKALAQEVGPSVVRVNCIAPGVIQTEMNGHLPPQALEALKEETPLEALGTPEDVARAVSFLCSPGAGFITGQVLGVNGGLVV